MISSTIARVDRTLMGVKCTVTVAGPTSAVIAQQCLESIGRYEQLWSRFIPTSDISRLNAAHGEPVFVDPMTNHLVAYMRAAYNETSGTFNPTLLPLQITAGDSSSLVDDKVTEIPTNAIAQLDMECVVALDDGRLQLTNNATLDTGGIAKGLTADLVLQDALSMGASKVCINIGGDMAIHTGTQEAWPVDIMSPLRAEHIVDTVLVSNGGVATSAVNARHRNGSSITNHIFTNDGPSSNNTIGATVLASHAAWAEAWTKFAIISDPQHAIDTISDRGLAALIVLNDGSTIHTESWKELAR